MGAANWPDVGNLYLYVGGIMDNQKVLIRTAKDLVTRAFWMLRDSDVPAYTQKAICYALAGLLLGADPEETVADAASRVLRELP
jgi:hypothetical protein